MQLEKQLGVRLSHRTTRKLEPSTGKLAQWRCRIGDEIVYRDVPAAICVNDTDMETQAVREDIHRLHG
ncbi:LysR family transcriptional regulator [Paraburkholderia phenoliruptrix]|uniref:LysR family transcriptional regulator n=1 Tax=Paraburkholderia phenoliruptrix TaxID=252970 RepID=UPI00286412B0|nr:hypothetical protein [Paraburkholderia phenoliruptrix]